MNFRLTYTLSILFSITFCLSGCSQQNITMTPSVQVRNYKLAMAQMKVEAGKLDANLDRATKRINEAAANGAKIVLLPEVMDLGWTDPSAKTLAYEIPDGKTCR